MNELNLGNLCTLWVDTYLQGAFDFSFTKLSSLQGNLLSYTATLGNRVYAGSIVKFYSGFKMKVRAKISLVILLVVHPVLFFAQGGQRYYVNASTLNNMQNGSSWATAFTDLQQALQLVSYGDTIWVAQGIYRPTLTPDRSISFVIPNGVSILGGFNGSEIEAIQRNWEISPTTLSGDIGVQGDSLDNSYHVIRIFGADSTTHIDGFVITHGYASKENDFGEANHGAGAYIGVNSNIAVSSPKFINCTFIWNSAKMDGGAVYTQKSGASMAAIPYFENCRFYENLSKQAGGAILMVSLDLPDYIQSRIRQCMFERNRAGFDGGAIHFHDIVGNHIVVDCKFIENYSFIEGGAIYCTALQNGGKLTVKGSEFIQNQARLQGGGISYNFWLGGMLDTFELVCYNTLFTGNIAQIGNGSAIQLSSSSNRTEASFYFCKFHSNQSNIGIGALSLLNSGDQSSLNITLFQSEFLNNTSLPNLGSCIYLDGALFAEQMSSYITIANSIFAHNEGALFFLPGEYGTVDAYIVNSTFYNNGQYPIAKSWSQNFNDITYYNNMTISNSIIWEEQADSLEIFHNNQSQLNLYDFYINNCLIIKEDACNLPGGETACGSGNIYGQYPLFIDTLNRSFGIAACSPAIDAGNNALPILFNMTTDYTGAPRIQQSTVDIGAYERPASWQTALAETANVTCPEGNDGAAYFTSTGDDPISYTWQNQSGSGTGNTGLSAGYYDFTLTDAAGCTDTATVTITEPLPLDIDYTIANASTPQSADCGIAVQVAAGGTSPFFFLWNTGDTTQALSGLPSGNYALTLTDANNCQAFYNFTVGVITAQYEAIVAGRFTLLPNPASAGAPAYLRHRLDEPGLQGRLRLYHSSGQQIWESDWIAATQESLTPLPCDQLPAGLYWLVLDLPGYQSVSWKWSME